MYSTRITRHVDAPRAAVYRALLDPDAVQRWMVPAGMTSEVHAFDAREGGSFRISLTYDAADAAGKTAANTDTQQGRFLELVPDERVVQSVAFVTDDPALGAPMTITYTLEDNPAGGTDVHAQHDGVPDSVPAHDNEAGWRSSLDKLAALVAGR